MIIYFKKLDPIQRLYITYGVCGVAASLAHPITPNLINNLNMPSYMFGLAFAAMSITNFLMSPFWGNLNNFVSSKNILAISMIGYSVGQFIFGFGGTKATIVIGRMIAGFFIAAMNVSALYYTMKFSNEEDVSKNITKTITIFNVNGTLGYLIGGVIGTANINYAIIAQCVGLLVCGVLFYFGLDDIKMHKKIQIKEIAVDSNPIQAFFKISQYLNIKILLLFMSVFFVTFASTSLTQNFQFYLQTYLKMSPSFGGITRSIVGILAVIANFTITIKLVSSSEVEKSISKILLVLILNLVLLYFTSEKASMFMVVGIILLVFDTVQISLFQERNASYASEENRGVMVGMHNSMKSLGMIAGSLLAGIMYDFNPFAPFMLSLVLYIITLLINTLNHRKDLDSYE